MKLIKRRDSETHEKAFVGEAIDRRAFLRRSGIGLGGAAVASGLALHVSTGIGAEVLNSIIG